MLMCDCDPQTRYECGGLGMSVCEYTRFRNEIYVALCESRHDIPMAINGSIFPETVEDPMDFEGMYRHVDAVLGVVANRITTLNLYVTGLTPALLETVNWCHDNNIKCVTWHFNRATGEYKELPMRG